MGYKTWLITGTRHGYAEVDLHLDEMLVKHGKPELMVLGDAKGVDTQAYEWAVEQGIDCIIFEADWHANGKAAGPIRNQEMVEYAGKEALCIGFPGPYESRGTHDCLKRAEDADMSIECYYPEGAKVRVMSQNRD